MKNSEISGMKFHEISVKFQRSFLLFIENFSKSTNIFDKIREFFKIKIEMKGYQGRYSIRL